MPLAPAPSSTTPARKTEEKFIRDKMDIVEQEILSNYSKFVDGEFKREEASLYISNLRLLRDFNTNVRAQEYHDLLHYMEDLQADLKRYEEQKAIREKRNFLDSLMKLTRRAGILGMIATTITMIAKSRTFMPVIRAISTPITMGIFAFNAIEDMIETWRNDQLHQRKTRYGTNLISLGIFGVGIAITAGAIVTVPFSLPLLLLGMIGVSYYKNTYIQKKLEAEIQEQKLLRSKKETELRNAIAAIYHLKFGSLPEEQPIEDINTTISNDPHIQRLEFQLNDHSTRIAKLQFQHKHANFNRKGLSGMFIGISLIIAGILTAPIPPLSLALGITGALIIAASATNYKSKISQRDLQESNAELDSLRQMQSETSLTESVYKQLHQKHSQRLTYEYFRARVDSTAPYRWVTRNTPPIPSPQTEVQTPELNYDTCATAKTPFVTTPEQAGPTPPTIVDSPTLSVRRRDSITPSSDSAHLGTHPDSMFYVSPVSDNQAPASAAASSNMDIRHGDSTMRTERSYRDTKHVP